MVGILLITHNGLGDSLIDCVRHVTSKEHPHLKSLSILGNDDPAVKELEGQKLIKQLDKGNGVLLLTDIYGATPSNIALRLCKPGHIAGVAGVSLAMLLRIICGPDAPLATLVQRAMQGGRDCIVALSSDKE